MGTLHRSNRDHAITGTTGSTFSHALECFFPKTVLCNFKREIYIKVPSWQLIFPNFAQIVSVFIRQVRRDVMQRRVTVNMTFFTMVSYCEHNAETHDS